MTIPPDFSDHCLYNSDCWFAETVEHLDADCVRVRADTTRLGPFVDAQVVRRGHPKHVPGAVMVQLTGTLGSLHCVYGLGLRDHVGYGTHIKGARFPTLGRIGPAMWAELTVTRIRRIRGRVFAEYAFQFWQEGADDKRAVIYLSEQSAIWMPGELAETAT